MLWLGTWSLRNLKQQLAHGFISMPPILAARPPAGAVHSMKQSRPLQGGVAAHHKAPASSSQSIAAKKYYAIRKGLETGVFDGPWDSVKHLVDSYKGSEFKAFRNRMDAEAWLGTGTAPLVQDRTAAVVQNTKLQPVNKGLTASADSRMSRLLQSGSNRDAAGVAGTRRPLFKKTRAAAAIPSVSAGWLQRSTGSIVAAASQEQLLASPSAGAVTAYHLGAGVAAGRLLPENVYRLYFDGGSRNNPGFAGYGAVLTEAATGQEVCHIAGYLPYGHTNNDAEYTALAEGVRIARQLGATELQLRGDSQLVVRQMTGQYRYTNMQAHVEQVASLLKGVTHDLQHVPREQNQVADALSNLGMDMCEVVHTCIADMEQDQVASLLEALDASTTGPSSTQVTVAEQHQWGAQQQQEEEGLLGFLSLRGLINPSTSSSKGLFGAQRISTHQAPDWEVPLRSSLLASALQARSKQLALEQQQASNQAAWGREVSVRLGTSGLKEPRAPTKQKDAAAQASRNSRRRSSSSTGSRRGSRTRGSSGEVAVGNPQPNTITDMESAARKPAADRADAIEASTPAAPAATAGGGKGRRGRPRKMRNAVQDGS